MRSTPILILAVVLPVSGLQADKVLLSDGRVLLGQCHREGDTVKVHDGERTHQVPASEVLEVLATETLTSIFDQRLSEIQLGDIEAMEDLARQGVRDGLEQRANQVWQAILELQPDHTHARRALGYLRVNEQWLTFPETLEAMREWIAEQPEDPDLLATCKQLQSRIQEPAKRFELTEIRGRILLANRDFKAAGALFELACLSAREAKLSAASVRFDALSRIVRSSPSGVYALAEPYPADAMLLGGARRMLRPGPVSLSHPLTLDAALRDAAKQELGRTSDLIEQAVAAENTDPDAARAKYLRAQLALDRADALVPGLGHTYRVEIARRRIKALRRDVDAEARNYDRQEDKLGARSLSDRGYRRLLERMVHHLDSLEEALEEIIAIAAPFEKELILEVQWAKSDLQTIRAKRRILKDEIHDQ